VNVEQKLRNNFEKTAKLVAELHGVRDTARAPRLIAVSPASSPIGAESAWRGHAEHPCTRTTPVTRYVFAVMLAAVISATALGQAQKTVVPAFFGVRTHTDPSKDFDWMRIADAGTAVFAVVADDTFAGLPGTTCAPAPGNCGPCSPTGSPPSCDGGSDSCLAKCQFTINRNAGQLVLGYVITNSGQRDLDTTIANCPRTDKRCALYGGDTYHLPDGGGYWNKASVTKWYDTYCPVDGGVPTGPCYIDGIFFDVGPSIYSTISVEPDQHNYYDDLYTKVINWSDAGPCSDAQHPHRPCVMINASQFTGPADGGADAGDWVLNAPAADYAVVWERALHGQDNQPPDPLPYQDYITNFIPNPIPTLWAINAAKAAHVVSVATQNDVVSIVNASRQTTRGFPASIYVHDRFGYGSLACFFEQEVAAAQNPATPQSQPAVTGKTWCDQANTCIDLNTNAAYCGGCDSSHSCPGTANGYATCDGGACGLACNPGWAFCGSSTCHDLSGDLSNCGSCGHVCPTGNTCVNGTCTPCGPSTCAGCCDANGVCQPGTTHDVCGRGGALCESCTPKQSCDGLGVCRCPNHPACSPGWFWDPDFCLCTQ
jgi:hypothetical protein